jgi:microcystin-dependent protein
VRLVPTVADAIPQSVLASPIIGEARRFDGASAPANWLLCQGQTLTIANYRALFAVLGTSAGGDGKTTFKLPNAKLIVAAGGSFPSSGAVFTQSKRSTSATVSLGPGAVPRMPAMPKPPSEAVLAQQRLVAEAVRVRPSAPTPVSADVAQRIQQAREDARSAALAALSAANQARLASAVDAAVAGSIRVYDAVVAMAGTLSDGEAQALLTINDAQARDFRGQPAPVHPKPQLEASYFLLSVALTPAQEEALAARERSSP